MSQDQSQIEHHRVEDQPDPGSRNFVIFATVLMIASLSFGLLTTFHVVNM
jgi:hypothetical protein